MSVHTPGPWQVGGTWNTTVHVPSKLIAHCTNVITAPNDLPEDQANARLIAAAPDMLAALEAVMYFWGRDPLAFGDEATINSLAGRFAVIADQCRIARDAAIGVEP